MGPSAFLVEAVHKISVVDISLAIANRNDGNILVSRDHDGQIELILKTFLSKLGVIPTPSLRGDVDTYGFNG